MFLNFCFATPTISLNDDPIKILDIKLPCFLSVLIEKFNASILNSPVTIESTFLFPKYLWVVHLTKSSKREKNILKK